MRRCWGLVQCSDCHKVWNRDVNSSLNILRIGTEAIMNNNPRPEYLRYRRRTV